MSAQQVQGFRLSPQQKRVWLLQGDGGDYRSQCAVWIEGDLKSGVLREAARDVVRRHEILRTTFRCPPGMTVPLQVIAEDGEPLWRESTLNEVELAAQLFRIEELLDQESQEFDFERDPLLRLRLASLSRQRHILMITIPTLCSDPATLNNLVSQIIHSYAALLEGGRISDEPLQYADFSEWQNEQLEQQGREAQSYWRDRGSLDALNWKLPFENTPSQVRERQAGRVHLAISPETRAAINALAATQSTSVDSLLLACWQVLLWRWLKLPELAVAMLCEGRVSEETHSALGLYARWPFVKCRFEERLQFDEILKQVSESARNAREWQHHFSLAEYTGLNGNADERLAIPAGFAFEEWKECQPIANLRLSTYKQYSCGERFKLRLSFVSAGDSLWADLYYDSAIYERKDVQRLVEQFETLLTSSLANPNAAIAELDILGRTERDQLLTEWNATTEEYPSALCIHEMFEAQSKVSPDAIAVIFEDEHVSYQELDRRGNQLARRLQRFGVASESLVGLFIDRSVEMIVGLLGILKAGGAYVPLDPGQPESRLDAMHEDSQVQALLTCRRLAPRLAGQSVNAICLDSDWADIERESDSSLDLEVSSDNLAYVIYTSGSTGMPKGVMIHHRSVMNLAAALRRAIYNSNGSGLRVSLNAPLAFDSSVKQLVQLLSGHSLCIVPDDVRRDGSELLSYVERMQVDALDCTPSQWKLVMSAGLEQRVDGMPRLVLIGGEALDEGTWTVLAKRCEHAYYNVYGPTECTVDAAICDVRTATQHPTIGTPISNARIYILDHNLRPQPIWLPGELHIAGAGLARGYKSMPDLTAERFTPDPFSTEPGERLYATGDHGRYRANGNIEFLGRSDFQVKIRGNRVELGEIEAVLQRHPNVREAVVVARESESNDRRLVAYVVPHRSRVDSDRLPGRAAVVHNDGNHHTATTPDVAREKLSTADLRSFLSARLPDYMLPSAILVLERLPLTRNGKVDREALPEPEQGQESEQGLMAPCSPVEEMLAGLYVEVLRTDVGINDNFFELGGHSLIATQLVSRVRKTFNVELPLRALFEAPTVAGLASRIQREVKAGRGLLAPSIQKAPRQGLLPTSFAQQRLWFLHQLERDSHFYNIYRIVRLTGPLNVSALEQTLNVIIQRHEVLRTTFTDVDGQPFQLIAQARLMSLLTADLSGLTAEELELQSKRIAAEQVGRPFDLARGPLLRVALLRLSEEEHVVVLVLHHIISDGWSMGVLVREVASLYEGCCLGVPSPLPELSIQYADFAVWQREWLRGEALEAHLQYWMGHLFGAPPLLKLPIDRPRPAVQSFRGASQSVLIPKALTDAMKSLSRREGVTLFMTLLAGFQSLLRWYTKQNDIVIGADIANRNQVETESLIGFFVNILALRTRMHGDQSFRDVLSQARDLTLGAYAHQDLPFEKIVEALQPDRSLSHAPVVQVVLVFQNAPLGTLQMPGLSLSTVGMNTSATKFDLILTLWESEEGLNGSFEYSEDLFNTNTIYAMAEHFKNVLLNVAEQPNITLNALEAMLDEADRQQRTLEQLEFKDARQKRLKNIIPTPVTC